MVRNKYRLYVQNAYLKGSKKSLHSNVFLDGDVVVLLLTVNGPLQGDVQLDLLGIFRDRQALAKALERGQAWRCVLLVFLRGISSL